MNVNDTKVWAPSNTGTKVHAFLGSRGAKEGNLRAACRTSIQRRTDARFVDQDAAENLGTLCDNCVTLYAAAEDRANASMQPATEAADLGYVAPVNERDEVQPEPLAVGETIRVGRDELHRVGEHWADVTLRNGRRYEVSLLIRRKGETGHTIILSDHVTYWSTRDGDNIHSAGSAGEADRPSSVGGRIWHLLGAAHLA